MPVQRCCANDCNYVEQENAERNVRLAPPRCLPPLLARVCSAAVQGIEAFPVEVEVNVGWGDTLIVTIVPKTPHARNH